MAVKACFNDLTRALELNHRAVLKELVAHGLISQSNIPSDAQRLAEVLLDVIEQTPERYMDILAILSKCDGMEDLVHTLRSEYSKFVHILSILQ